MKIGDKVKVTSKLQYFESYKHMIGKIGTIYGKSVVADWVIEFDNYVFGSFKDSELQFICCGDCTKLRRKNQKLQSQLNKALKEIERLNQGINTWSSPERQKEAEIRDEQMAAIARASAKEIYKDQTK